MILVHTTLGDIKILKVFTHAVVTDREIVKGAENTICDTCGLIGFVTDWNCDICTLKSRRYEIFEVLAHNVVISRKTVK